MVGKGIGGGGHGGVALGIAFRIQLLSSGALTGPLISWAPASSPRVGSMAFTDHSLTQLKLRHTPPASALNSHKHPVKLNRTVCLSADASRLNCFISQRCFPF